MNGTEPATMRQLDYLKSIFQLFLCFLSEAAVGELIERCLREEGGSPAAKRFSRLLDATADELLHLVWDDGDEEDKVAYLNVLLWGQARGRIARDLRVYYTFDEGYYNWLIHRQMVANGYDWRSLSWMSSHRERDPQSYLAEIETYLSAFESSEKLEDASHLAMLLNVIGPKITSYIGLPRVMRFIQHIIECKDDDALYWLSPSAFAMLVQDLSYSPAESWAVFRRLIRMEHNQTIFNYHGLLLGIRIYGQPARDELRNIRIPGGYNLLEAIATRITRS